MVMPPAKVRFGPFELDIRAGELSKGRRRVRLQEKPLRLLLALVEQPNQVVTREELRVRLWPANIVVEFDNGLNNAVNKLRHVLGDSASAPKYVETVGRRGYRFIGTIAAGLDETEQVDGSEPNRIRSLAVLPLENLSNDAAQEYFSDGMTDALISQLAGIGSLRIISRQSVMRYKRSVATVPEIARALRVDALVEGTVLKFQGRVRISVQLIDASNDCHLWSARYERSLGDVIAMQSEIAQAVAMEVRAAVTEQETARLARPAAIHPQAYDLYLRGRHFWAQRSEAGLLRSLDYFRRALDIEPGFARAHAAIAEAYGPLGSFGYVPAEEAARHMKAAALRALQIDPELVEGLAARAACAAFHEWKWEEAEAYFRRALELGPNYAMGFGWYGLLLENTGRQVENLRARERAFELNPLWIATGLALGSALFFNGRVDEAIAVTERTLELEPGLAAGLIQLGKLYEATGQLDRAIDSFVPAGDSGELGHAYAVAGRRADALGVLVRLEEQARYKYVAPYNFALIHVGLGDAARALSALERGVEIRDPRMSGLKVDPRFAPLADAPRFAAILEKMGLGGASRESVVL
jgi:TolB-like protein